MTKIGGKAILIVGARGMGKGSYLKPLIKNIPRKYVYDINDEYGLDFEPIPFQDFVFNASQLKKSIIVFEEATIFIGHSSSSETLREILVRARHTENTIFLVFHSLRAIPRFIYDLCTDIVLHKTNDSQDFVQRRFENNDLTESVKKLATSKAGVYPNFPRVHIKLQ